KNGLYLTIGTIIAFFFAYIFLDFTRDLLNKPGIMILSQFDINLFNKIQNLRKDQGFEVIDRIEILFNTNSDLKDALLNMKDYVQSETLAVNMNYDENLQDGTEIDILENKVKVIIKKV
ncbi:MAG TPA: DUF5915 domain-containing protein, partial [Bacteroidota bacterium]|nr:DUF5915 domain-containing protein [Bacteroidota bacterium]